MSMTSLGPVSGNHAIIVGGTGMLRGVALELASRGWVVSVVARGLETLERLAAEGSPSGRIVPLAADYSDETAFYDLARDRFDEQGPPRLIVAWIHVTAPHAPVTLARAVSSTGTRRADYYHVVCRIRTPDPRDLSITASYAERATIEQLSNIRYREIVLGWRVTEAGSRWLTNEEIAAGVIEAIDGGCDSAVIGQDSPIGSHPA